MFSEEDRARILRVNKITNDSLNKLAVDIDNYHSGYYKVDIKEGPIEHKILLSVSNRHNRVDTVEWYDQVITVHGFQPERSGISNAEIDQLLTRVEEYNKALLEGSIQSELPLDI